MFQRINLPKINIIKKENEMPQEKRMTATMETITPEQAEYILKNKNKKNRAIKGAHLNCLVQEFVNHQKLFLVSVHCQKVL
jgi:hypothetical protein